MSTTAWTDAGMLDFNGPGADGRLNFTKGPDGLWRDLRTTTNGGVSASGATGGLTPSQAARAAAGLAAGNQMNLANSSVATATGAAQQNLGAAQNTTDMAAARLTGDLASAQSQAAQVGQTAATLGPLATKVGQTATQVGATANIFEQYAAQMAQDAVFAQANALPWLQTGNDLNAMNPNAGGMAGEWSKLYGQMAPDSLAAAAGTNTRKAASVAQDDLMRSLARRGISAGSGAIAAAMGKIKEREAASVASMMTAARQTGISMQADALQKGFAMALQASGLGQSMMNDAVKDISAASAAQGQATAALTAQGSLQAQAASIVANQGGMQVAGGNLALGIAQTRAQGTSAQLSALNAATNTQVNAQAMAADYYSTQAGSIMSILTQQGYNVLSTLFPSIPGSGTTTKK